jgi:hypothetical protein
MKLTAVVLGAFLLLIYQMLPSALAQKELVPYLKENSISLQSENPAWNNVFDDTFYQNQVFLLGERHGIAYSYDVLWQFVSHLKAKTNFKYYLLEAPLYWEINLNQYFETGNESYLKKPFQEAKGTFYANQDFYNFYKKLYKLNQSLAPNDRIEFVSIDVEHQYKYSHAMLLDLLKKYPKSAADDGGFVKFFFDNDPEKSNEYKKTYRLYQNKWNENKPALKQVLGTDFERIDYLIRNINFKFEANDDPKDLARDSLMYLNFQYRAAQLDFAQKKIFGFMGIDHCYTEATPKFKYFAAYLPKNQYKTTSTIMLYANSETLMPNHYLPKFLRFLGGKNGYFTTKMRSNDRPFEYQKKIGLLKDIAQDKLTLFKLNQPQSPFKKHSVFVDNLKTTQPTTDFMQYIVLVPHSPAAKVLTK